MLTSVMEKSGKSRDINIQSITVEISRNLNVECPNFQRTQKDKQQRNAKVSILQARNKSERKIAQIRYPRMRD